ARPGERQTPHRPGRRGWRPPRRCRRSPAAIPADADGWHALPAGALARRRRVLPSGTGGPPAYAWLPGAAAGAAPVFPRRPGGPPPVITELHACPPTYPMSSRETLPLRFDLSALLAPGETPTARAASLVRRDTGAAYPAGLSGTPVISDHYLTQSVTGLAAFI